MVKIKHGNKTDSYPQTVVQSSLKIFLSIEAQPVCRIGDSHLLHLLEGYTALEHAWQNIHMNVMVAVSTVGSLNKNEIDRDIIMCL